MDILLIAGLWLDASVWDRVIPGLRSRGHRPIAVSLPGQGDGGLDATLDDQINAVVAAIDSAGAPVLIVGHSAASSLAWLGADRRPEHVAGTALIGGFPNADGEAYAAFFDIVDGVMPFPGWEPFAGPDSDDLDEAAKQQIAERAIPVPEGVASGVVHLGNTRRYAVPVTLICPEFTPEQAREWVAAGDVPELAAAQHLAYADIGSGHWPMVSAPDALARVIADIADRNSDGGHDTAS